MTDQTIPADKVREVRDLHRDAAKMVTITDAEREIHQHVADAMEALLPTPPLPTLADMSEEERPACQWMQADTKLWGRVVIIVPDLSDGRTALLDQSGDVIYGRYVNVTPLPDLPRMEWPGDKKPVDVPPVKVGDVIESADDPRLDALPVGTVLVDCDGEPVAKQGEAWLGAGFEPIESEGDEFGPWTVRRIGWESDQ